MGPSGATRAFAKRIGHPPADKQGGRRRSLGLSAAAGQGHAAPGVAGGCGGPAPGIAGSGPNEGRRVRACLESPPPSVPAPCVESPPPGVPAPCVESPPPSVPAPCVESPPPGVPALCVDGATRDGSPELARSPASGSAS
jgi:hypothetical protein